MRDRSVAPFSRNYPFSANMQVIVDETRLVIAAARPVPGTTADAHAERASGLARHCRGVTVPISTAGWRCRTTNAQAAVTAGRGGRQRGHGNVRARVEHAIGRMKNYKILRDCRQRGEGLHHAVQAVAAMHNLDLTYEQTTLLTRSGLPEYSLVQQRLTTSCTVGRGLALRWVVGLGMVGAGARELIVAECRVAGLSPDVIGELVAEVVPLWHEQHQGR
ncbi:transposase family protein [Streptomyces chartreusis]